MTEVNKCGAIRFTASTVLAFLVALVTALTFHFTSIGAISADVRENRARIEHQEKRTDRILDKLDRIEALLLERREGR